MELEGKSILIPAADRVDEKEFLYPYFRLAEAGARVVTASLNGEAVTGNYGMASLPIDQSIDDLSADEFDGIVIPGGFAPDFLRRSEHLLSMVRSLDEAGKLVAFICHAGWVPISAGILSGRRATSVHAIRHDMINAGVDWVDEPVVTDNNLVSSRTPADLMHFLPAIIKRLAD